MNARHQVLSETEANSLCENIAMTMAQCQGPQSVMGSHNPALFVGSRRFGNCEIIKKYLIVESPGQSTTVR